MEKLNLILERFLLEIQSKMIKKIRGGKNESFKCSSAKELNDAIMKIKKEEGSSHIDLAMVLDIKENDIYVVDRSSFHSTICDNWSIPYNEQSKRYIFCTGNYSDSRGFKSNPLSFNTTQRKALQDADRSWMKGVIKATL